MKRLILIVSLIAIVLSYPMNVRASNIANAIYFGGIVVTNNGTSAASSVTANMTLSSADLISQGYVNSTFSNVAIRNSSGSDVPFMPGFGSNPWMLWVPSIGASSIMNYTLYSGGPDMSSTKYYFPGSSGATVADSPSLELSSNGSIQMSAYIDGTQPVSNLFYKPGAFKVLLDAGNNMTAILSSLSIFNNSTNTLDLRVGNGSIIRQGERLNSFAISYYTSANLTLQKIGAPTGTANITIRKVSDDSILANLGTIDVSTIPAAYTNYTFAYNGTGAFVNPSVQDVRLLVEYNGGDAGNYVNLLGQLADVYPGGVETSYVAAYTDVAGDDVNFAVFSGTRLSFVEASSGLKNIRLTNAGGSFTFTDGTSTATTTNVTVPDINSNIVWGSVVTPYIQSMNMTVGGNLKGSWAWQYAATFTDLSGNGNTMTPSFPTGSSNANVWGTLATFSPLTQANAPAYTVTNPQAFYSTNVILTGSFATGNVTGAGLPGSALVDEAASKAGLPNVFLWGVFGGLFIVAGGFLISGLVRHNSGGNGELIGRMIWGIFVLGVLIALGKFEMWMLWFYLILTIACALASRHNEVGAYFSELNFIGFLSMSEIGMVMINRTLEGAIINATDASQFNNLMFTQQFTILNVFTLPIVNFDFFTKGLPNLVKWNYVMFGGNAQMIQYLLYSLTAIMAFIIFGLVIGTLSHYFTK